MLRRQVLSFSLIFMSFFAFSQAGEKNNVVFRDTIFNLAFDSLKHNFGEINPETESKYLVKHFKYKGHKPLRIVKAWTGDPHYICDYPKEDLIPNKVYSFKVCFSHKGREGIMNKQMGFDLSDGNRVFMQFTAEYVKQ